MKRGALGRPGGLFNWPLDRCDEQKDGHSQGLLSAFLKTSHSGIDVASHK